SGAQMRKWPARQLREVSRPIPTGQRISKRSCASKGKKSKCVPQWSTAQLLLIETRALREPLNFSTSTKATRLLLVIRVCALCRCSVRQRIPIYFILSIRSLMPTNQSRPSFANSVRSCIAHTQRKGKSPLSPDRRLCGPARVSIWSDSLKQGILIGFSLEIRLRLTMWSAHCSEHHWE